MLVPLLVSSPVLLHQASSRLHFQPFPRFVESAPNAFAPRHRLQGLQRCHRAGSQLLRFSLVNEHFAMENCHRKFVDLHFDRGYVSLPKGNQWIGLKGTCWGETMIFFPAMLEFSCECSLHPVMGLKRS